MFEFDLKFIIGIFGLLFSGVLIFAFKSYIIKAILFVFWYPLLPMCLFSIGIPLSGSIEIFGRSAYGEFAIDGFFLALLGFLVLISVLWKYRRSKIKIKRLIIGERTRILIILLLMVVSIIAYPKAWGIGTSRWNLLPGTWSVIYLAINGLLIISISSIKSFSTIIHLLLLLFVIKGGERVDSIMPLFLIVSLESDKENKSYIIESEIGIIKVLFGLAVLVLGIYVGYSRLGNQFSFGLLLHNIIALHTVTDVIHVYLSSFYYVNNYGINLFPIINETFSLIPLHPWGGGGNEFNFTEILRGKVYNYGGGLFYTEGVLIFGKMGVLIYSFLFGRFIKILLKFDYQLVSVFMVMFLILLLRVQWYGLVYLYTPVLALLIIVGCFNVLKVIYPVNVIETSRKAFSIENY
ncbi:MAG: hypothetical protein JXC36_02560 [Candidatus Atribacteria bacterium]|nr:hypothetical protein [Candidatus Atribacteria bacterium]